MANLVRRTAIGPGAEVLVNKGRKFLRYVDGLPDFFGGNEMMNQTFKNAMANRTRMMADGSALVTRRGAGCDKVVATTAPGPASEALQINYYIALEIYDDAGTNFAGVLLFDLRNLGATPKFFPMASISAAIYYKTGYEGMRYVKHAVEVSPGRWLAEAPGGFDSGNWVNNVTSNSNDTTGTAGDHFQRNYHALTTIKNSAGTVLHAQRELILVDDWDRDAAITNLDGHAVAGSKWFADHPIAPGHPGTMYCDAAGFATKFVFDSAPYPPWSDGIIEYGIYFCSGGRSTSGSRHGGGLRYGWISAVEHLYATYTDETVTETAAYELSASTIGTDYFLLSGEEQVPQWGDFFSDALMTWDHVVGLNFNTVAPTLPVLSRSYSSISKADLHYNGVTFTILDYDAYLVSPSFSWLNYYPNLLASPLAAYVLSVNNYDTSVLESLRVGTIMNGKRHEAVFSCNAGGLTIFGSTARFTYGEARILVELP